MLAVVLAHLVDRHDARVVQKGDGLGLVLEPPELVVAGQQPGLDHLEGHGAVEADLPSLVDDAHAAAAQFAADFIVAEIADMSAAGRPGSDWPLTRAVVPDGRPETGIGRVECGCGALGLGRRRPGRAEHVAGLGEAASSSLTRPRSASSSPQASAR